MVPGLSRCDQAGWGRFRCPENQINFRVGPVVVPWLGQAGLVSYIVVFLKLIKFMVGQLRVPWMIQAGSGEALDQVRPWIR